MAQLTRRGVAAVLDLGDHEAAGGEGFADGEAIGLAEASTLSTMAWSIRAWPMRRSSSRLSGAAFPPSWATALRSVVPRGGFEPTP